MDWKVKVRVIREWRGATMTGEPFKGYNLLLLDAKNCRMQVYVPASMADRMARMIEVGKIYIIKNFQVKEYKDQDKFRPVQIDRQITFITNTKVKEIEETDVFIHKNMFDFYAFEDLKGMAKQYHHLIDGRTKINVTFWDSFAVEFEKEMNKAVEEPIILIIASARVSTWQDQIDICNYSPTMFYLNYDHHSVIQLRKMLKEPNFDKVHLSAKKKTFKQCTVDEIKNLGIPFIQDEVICKGKIKSVEEIKKWKVLVCTSCYEDIEDMNCDCKKCNRNVPYPNKKFKIPSLLSDDTGEMEITLLDREVRTILGKNVFDVENEDDMFPNIIKTMEGKDYTFKIFITEDNINQKNKVYKTIDIFLRFDMEEEMPSGSSYHLDEISQLNYQTT
ncbi:hypothetical protein POM88_008446 [Heracleum sosnowskyi]|uniref:DUF223 domain-containing protein n=1 Tax=Heracleum sosnowskyi TaxID=360622 RepID=A0AAD8N8K6_9APIA|nr:hypothetical protein POM88_008446 [Heracleum sosnowskyi]